MKVIKNQIVLIIMVCLGIINLYGCTATHQNLFGWKEHLVRDIVTGSKMIDTKKGPIEYTINGESGPYLVIMHGGPGGYDQTSAFFSDMFGKGFRILSWSRPGYIRTPLEVGKTYEEQADVVAALMDALKIDHAAVLGYSAGGPPAIYFAARYPERTWALILECAVTQKYTINPKNLLERIYFGFLMFNDSFVWASNVLGELAPSLIAMSTIEMESSLDNHQIVKLVDDIMHDEQRVKVFKDIMKSMTPGELRKKGMDNDMNQLAKVKNLPLNKIKTPTLIIHGTNDADVPLADAELAAQEIPNSQLYLVPEGFHIMALTNSIERVNEKRVTFLKVHAPSIERRENDENPENESFASTY
jgi:pimeloyl-ACP methyl ester carboxylesterase